MDSYNSFRDECSIRQTEQFSDQSLSRLCREFFNHSFSYKYPYNFEFLGRPIIQYPQDMVAMQEIVWNVRPDLIIETGIAHGGSLIMSASMLALVDICEAIETGAHFNPMKPKREVLGVDIEIRSHNRMAIESHPMSNRIKMIEGSSVASEVISRVQDFAERFERVLVCLDSNHTHDHVLKELELYGPLTSVGSYCVVFDTVIEDMPQGVFNDRPWGPGNSPKSAVREYLKVHPEFIIDKDIESKLLITVSPDGFLKRIAA